MQVMRRVSLVAAAAVLAACSDPTAAGRAPIGDLPRPLSDAERSVIAANNTFSFSLLHRLNTEVPDENLFISPLSVSMALGMTMNGTGGQTQTEMRDMLGFAGLEMGEVNESYRSLINLLRGLDPSVDFRLANSIWYEQTFPVEATFLETTSDYFDATVRSADFRDAGTVDVINGWVDNATAGKIDEIIDVIEPDVVMYLINAIYFKGDWTTTFEAKDTKQEPFAGVGGTTTVPLMHKTDSVAYANVNGTQIIELPYGGEAFAMSVLLPPPGTDITAFVAGLTQQEWDALHAATTGQTVDIFLPKFTLESEYELKDALRTLGMHLAFKGGDFSPMSSSLGDKLEVSRVEHKTFVDVHEKGTEAAAVTAVEVVVVCACGPNYPVFRADRPFVFAIRERLSGTILFIGKIAGL